MIKRSLSVAAAAAVMLSTMASVAMAAPVPRMQRMYEKARSAASMDNTTAGSRKVVMKKVAKHIRKVGVACSGKRGANQGKCLRDVRSRTNSNALENAMKKVTVCHNGKTITIAATAWKAHEKHGDTEGMCSGTGGSSRSGMSAATTSASTTASSMSSVSSSMSSSSSSSSSN